MPAGVAIAALASGNFAYEVFSETYRWGLATERTYFQIIAVVVFLLLSGVRTPKSP
jgi:hypothetical protein